MKERIIEIVEIGQPQSLIQRENAPITELIKTDMLIEELNEQLRLYNVVGRSEQCSGSLLSDEEIREAADEWVFDENGMKWSNNDGTAGDNYGSFIAGVKWVLSRTCNDR